MKGWRGKRDMKGNIKGDMKRLRGMSDVKGMDLGV